MIALDTNALVRVAVEDDPVQAGEVRALLAEAERRGVAVYLAGEVILESVWVLESVYGYDRPDVADFVEQTLGAGIFRMPDRELLYRTVLAYRDGGDFADLLLVERAKSQGATRLASFDKALSRRLPGFVVRPSEALAGIGRETEASGPGGG